MKKQAPVPAMNDVLRVMLSTPPAQHKQPKPEGPKAKKKKKPA